jgi:hypothetical protein
MVPSQSPLIHSHVFNQDHRPRRTLSEALLEFAVVHTNISFSRGHGKVGVPNSGWVDTVQIELEGTCKCRSLALVRLVESRESLILTEGCLSSTGGSMK